MQTEPEDESKDNSGWRSATIIPFFVINLPASHLHRPPAIILVVINEYAFLVPIDQNEQMNVISISYISQQYRFKSTTVARAIVDIHVLVGTLAC